jgi:TadE-like protein
MKKVLHLVVVDSDAQEVAELAIVLPILFGLIIGIYSFGRAYNIYSTITRAAQAGARVAVVSTQTVCPTCTSSCYWPSTTFPCDDNVSQAVKDVVLASHLDVSKIAQPSPKPNPAACPDPNLAKSCAPASDGSNVYICRNVILNTTSNTALRACGTIVSFQYPYEFLPVPFLRRVSVNIPAIAQTRVEY